ncbi:MAG TPA: ABC transporter permease [Phototrophicaceae bacterium]|nr:ABC transporter permease [Phototrophicaceae bacterium]
MAAVTQLNTSYTDRRRFGESLFRKGMRRLSHDPLSLIALSILVILALLALFGPIITTQVMHIDPNTTDPVHRLQPIGTPGHILGTDDVGRDQLARLLYAGRISMAIGFFGAVITLVIGMAVGLAMGYFGGVIDEALSWVVATLDSIPDLFLLILIASILSPNAATLVLVIALIGWTGTTRLIRGQTIALRGLDYVISARAIGASSWRIMFVHIVPNLISVVMISLATGIGGLILTESALSFLGLGVQPPEATWGNMLSNAQTFYRTGPHLVLMPGLLIFITVLCLYVAGDGLRDAFDPTTVD